MLRKGTCTLEADSLRRKVPLLSVLTGKGNTANKIFIDKCIRETESQEQCLRGSIRPLGKLKTCVKLRSWAQVIAPRRPGLRVYLSGEHLLIV